jgi:hypothetical protein
VPVLYQLVIDCSDADRLARFWAAALGYQLAPLISDSYDLVVAGSPLKAWR